MGKRQKFDALLSAFLVAIAALLQAGCQSRPELKQVASNAPERPINTEESAAKLKQKYQK